MTTGLRARLFLSGVLLVIGAGWGLTQPLTKIAVSTGHGQFGLIFWQLVIGVICLGAITAVRGKWMPLARRYWSRYLIIALGGTVIPNSTSYVAAFHLPSGVMSIMISLVPMFALPMALAVAMERFDILRMLGVICGALAVVMIVGPSGGLPDAAMAPWVLVAAIAPFMYAVEGTWVARYGTLDLDPVQLLFGASVTGAIVAAPLAWFSGQWIDPTVGMGRPEWALVASSVIHAAVYSAYVWMVGRSGSVFASQVSYVVTGSGVIWAMLLLSERYSLWVWGALVIMLLGVFLVRPRENPAP